MPGGVKDGVRDDLAGEQLDEVGHVRPLTKGEARATSELPSFPDGRGDTGEHELRHGSGTFPFRSAAGWRWPDALLVQGDLTELPPQLGRQTVPCWVVALQIPQSPEPTATCYRGLGTVPSSSLSPASPASPSCLASMADTTP